MSDAPFGRPAIYAHLPALIGSKNAWRTSEELAAELGAKNADDRLRVQQSLFALSKGSKEEPPRITRRLRAGTRMYECMALIVDAKDELRAPRRNAGPPRVEIAAPAAGAVSLRVEPVPAPVLPEPSPEAVEAVEKLVRSPEPTRTLADVLRKHVEARTAAAAETGPLTDSNGPIAGEAPTEVITIERYPDRDDISFSRVDAQPAPIVQPDTKAERAAIAERDPEAAIDDVSNELAAFGELVARAKRPAPAIDELWIKQGVQTELAALVPPRVAHYLREIGSDLARVGA